MLLKTKDYFTLGNALGGFYCIIFVIRGELELASWAILIAYFFDVSDGLVARLTKQFNKFGAELDNVADLVAYSIAPSFLIYGFYTQHPVFPALPWWLASAIASLPTLAGCVRFARFNVKRIHYDGVWMGFPRPASALLYIGFFNSHIFEMSIYVYYFGLFVVVYCSAMHFVLVPFINHHRSHTPLYLKVSYFFILSSVLISIAGYLLTGILLTWDVIAIWLLLYLFVHRYLTFSPKERAEIKAFVEEWKADETAI